MGILKKLIAGNWKMNPSSSDDALTLASSIKDAPNSNKVEWLICPPMPFLTGVLGVVENSCVSVGSQDCSEFSKGAYTGQTSSDMLASIGCKYAIIGHSERRSLLGETDEVCMNKAILALEAKITPIICVGESLAERKSGDAYKAIEKSLSAIAPIIDKSVIAYEPLWSIGTGISASHEDISLMHCFIREKTNSRILYGGSVNPQNARDILNIKNVGGVLVGGASLDAKKFLAIGGAA